MESKGDDGRQKEHTIKKIILLLSLVAAFAGTAVSAPSAFANAGCGTHQVQIVDFVEVGGDPNPADSVDVSYDFQCGGSTSNWRIVSHLQQSVSGSWVNDACGGGALCTVYRPGPTSYFTAGTEHGLLNTGSGPDWTWHPDDQIENQWFRVQTIVHFANGDPNLTYYSAERQG